MTNKQSLRLVTVIGTLDHKEWSKKKIDLFSRMIEDLDYPTTHQAIEWLIKHRKWTPTVAEIRERAEIIGRRQRECLELAQNRAERRRLEDRRGNGRPAIPEAVRELIRKIKDIPGVTVPEEKGEVQPLTPEQIQARKLVLRQQAKFLREQEDMAR